MVGSSSDGLIMGSMKKGEKYEGYYWLEVFLIGGNLTELCLYIIHNMYLYNLYSKSCVQCTKIIIIKDCELC